MRLIISGPTFFCWIAFIWALFPVCTSAFTPVSEEQQRVYVGYAPSGGGWWTGLAVTNIDDHDTIESMSAKIYAANGTLMCTTFLPTLGPHQMHAALLADLLTCNATLPDRVSLVFAASGETLFQVTTFVGNLNNGGFAFQQQTSVAHAPLVL